MKLGRRFIFATIAILCATGTTCYLKYPAAEYIKLVGIVVGIFTLAQSYTDVKGNNGKSDTNS